jgi:hypothetical protein
MALYAFDGTWNEEKTGEDAHYTNTNVVRFYRAYHARSGRQDFYVAGVGTRFDLLGKVLGGAFGLGELARLDEAYTALCRNWIGGDRDIDVVGFSRGAATTLDFCRMLQDRGIRDAHGATVAATPPIRFLGVWDIVDAFGLGFLGVNDFNFGHALSLPRTNVQFAFHALALDERRPSFLPTRLRGAWEVWFRGVHSDIGGGNGNRGLNDITLKWMFSKAKAAGLPIAQADIDALQPDPQAAPRLDKEKGLLKIRAVSDTDRRHYTVSALEGCENPADTCPDEDVAAEGAAIALTDSIKVLPDEVRARMGILIATAIVTANHMGFSLEGVHEGLWNLVEHRIVLVTSDADLQRARIATVRLVSEMAAIATSKGFIGVLNDFFLTAALFKLAPIFPYAD